MSSYAVRCPRFARPWFFALRPYPRIFAGVFIGAVLAVSGSVLAGEEVDAGSKDKRVLTFHGLRRLEEDPKISDEHKRAAWDAFVKRATEQVAYAKKAVVHWERVAEQRLVKTAQAYEADAGASVDKKIHAWRALVDRFPKASESGHAQKRIADLKAQETARRVEVAEHKEASRRNKVVRLQAWGEVLAWTQGGPEADKAAARVRALRGQLYAEASSLDRLVGIDAASKIRLWQEVLDGRPTPRQSARALKRIEALRGQR